MKPILALPVLVLLSSRGREQNALSFEPDEGTTLKRTFEAAAEYELADLAFSVDGEPIEGMGELPELTIEFNEHIEVSDEIVGVDGGRPSELVRTFDDLRQETSYSSGDEQQESSSGSDLEGRRLRFTWNGDEETYDVASADEGDELDDDVSRWLREDMDLRAVLPDGEVEAGDEWELEPELYLTFMWPSGLLEFRDEGQDVTELDREMNQETIERLAGTASARLEELREEDGLTLAVLHVRFEVTTSCDGEIDTEDGPVTTEVEIERTIEGTILWDVEHGHAHSAELEAEASRLTTRSRTMETDEGDIEFEESELFEGTIRYTATIERE